MSRSLFATVSGVLFVVGLIVIFSSVGWGSGAANAYLRSHGGNMDASQFTLVLQEYFNMYMWVGGILAITGGLGFVKSIELK